MAIEFRNLADVDRADIIELMNNPLVRRQMPLTSDNFDEAAYEAFLVGKQKLWDDHGYGPWAFVIDGRFAGWGGLQPEGEDVDLAIVLHPDYWGMGKAIYDLIIAYAFEENGFDSVIILLPPSRTSIKGVLRLGFEQDGEMEFFGERFIRYRLYRPEAL